MSRYGRPGGPVVATWSFIDGHWELYLEDAEHGGGLRMAWPSAAWARAWVDELSWRLDDLSDSMAGDDE